MLFSSPIFLFSFLPITLFVYYIFLLKTKRVKNYFLLLMSLIFYAWGEPKFIVMLIVSIVINWLFGILIDKNRENKKKSRLIIASMLLANLSILIVFKYLGFLVTNINVIFKDRFLEPMQHFKCLFYFFYDTFCGK